MPSWPLSLLVSLYSARPPRHRRPHHHIPHVTTISRVFTADLVYSCAHQRLLTVHCASDLTRIPTAPQSLTAFSLPPTRPDGRLPRPLPTLPSHYPHPATTP